jgi:hypothetical protein
MGWLHRRSEVCLFQYPVKYVSYWIQITVAHITIIFSAMLKRTLVTTAQRLEEWNVYVI